MTKARKMLDEWLDKNVTEEQRLEIDPLIDALDRGFEADRLREAITEMRNAIEIARCMLEGSLAP